MTNSVCFINPTTGEKYPLTEFLWCSPGGTPLMVSELPGITRSEIEIGAKSIWRYGKALPFDIGQPISLGEGCTPLVAASYEGVQARFKLENTNPSGSFKDRGASLLISFLHQQGVKEVCEDSSGNGGSAIAAYGAAAGMKVNVLVPSYAQPPKIAQIQAYGANVIKVPGPREATEEAAMEMAKDIFYASHNWHPMFLQGTKTLGYELWEDLGFKVPDNIIIPVGAGSSLLGCYLAFKELMVAGETERMPRLFAVQPMNCSPLHAAFQGDKTEIPFAKTIAEGTAIKYPIRMKEMLNALKETGGGTIALDEGEIARTALALAQQGIYVEPTSAQTAADMKRLLDKGVIHQSDETVVILTGSGLKATAFYSGQFEGQTS